MDDIIKKLKGGLIVYCQALADEPLYGSSIMAGMAYAAQLGGAVGIRANTPEDIAEIKKKVVLPVIGLIKKDYEDSEVYITPTKREVEALAGCNCEIIALDATNRTRPGGETLAVFFKELRESYPKQLFMADCSCYEDALFADEIGFDLVSTTLRGYTSKTRGVKIPDFELLLQLVKDCRKPVIAEGGIWTPEELRGVFECGVHAAVVGTAITRPMEITRRFVNAIRE